MVLIYIITDNTTKSFVTRLLFVTIVHSPVSFYHCLAREPLFHPY